MVTPIKVLIFNDLHKYFNTYFADNQQVKSKLNELLKKLIEIKNNLGLTKIVCPKLTLNKTPKLIIANTYTKDTLGRRERIQDIEKLLKYHNVDYEILK